MTALQAAGGGLPLALHIPNVVEQVGSIAGFAAVIGLAVLTALYFSQARDLRRLREWAGRAPERAAEMGPGGQQVPAPVPGRVVAVPQRAPQAVQGPPAAAAATAAGAAGTVPGAASQGAQPSGSNGSPGVEVAKAPDGEDAKVAAAAGDGAAVDDAVAATDAGQGEDKADAAGQAAAAPGGAKPGMPAPASAAAAGAASATAPAGSTGAVTPPPGVGGAPAGAAAAAARAGAPAQRPPGSVLPPRTGTLPPVRRLPSSNVGRPAPAQTGSLGSTTEPKRKRNPVYVVLAIAGVVILGAGAAIGVPALVNGAKDKKSSSTATPAATKKKTSAKKAAPVAPGKITVAVLNGTGIPGLAAQIGDRVEADGFSKGTVSNASSQNGQRANSVAMYAAGHERDAAAVAKKLGIRNVAPVDANSQSIAGDATVVVIVGSDKTQ